MRRSSKKSKPKARAAQKKCVITQRELARLGEGQLAYIREMSPREARELFPDLKGLPRSGVLFGVCHADGTPMALTDSRQAAVGHAKEDELEILSVH